MNDGATVKSGERVEVLLTIEAKNNYEYLVFEDLKPAGLEAAQVRSGQPLYAQELKSSTVNRRFSTNAPASGRLRENAADESTRAVTRAATAAIRDPQSAVDSTGRTRWVYQELRDRKVALFIDKLPEGVWEIRYDLRAEVPGQFHALPVLGHAMYVPEIRCNSDEVRLRVQTRRNLKTFTDAEAGRFVDKETVLSGAKPSSRRLASHEPPGRARPEGASRFDARRLPEVAPASLGQPFLQPGHHFLHHPRAFID